MPGMGSLRKYKNPELSGLRMWPVKGFDNYLIFYLTKDKSIYIVRVLHGKQDIDRAFGPLETNE